MTKSTKSQKPLKGYGQMFRGGITMRQKWAIDKRIKSDQKLFNQKPGPMGRNEL